jgi:hypothetical protein
MPSGYGLVIFESFKLIKLYTGRAVTSECLNRGFWYSGLLWMLIFPLGKFGVKTVYRIERFITKKAID